MIFIPRLIGAPFRNYQFFLYLFECFKPDVELIHLKVQFVRQLVHQIQLVQFRLVIKELWHYQEFIKFCARNLRSYY